MQLVKAYPDGLFPIDVEWANRNPPTKQTIELKWLIFKPQVVDLAKVVEWFGQKNWPPIGVLEWCGLYYLVDGYHRAFAAMLDGQERIIANVIQAQKADTIPLISLHAARAEQDRLEAEEKGGDDDARTAPQAP